MSCRKKVKNILLLFKFVKVKIVDIHLLKCKHENLKYKFINLTCLECHQLGKWYTAHLQLQIFYILDSLDNLHAVHIIY